MAKKSRKPKAEAPPPKTQDDAVAGLAKRYNEEAPVGPPRGKARPAPEHGEGAHVQDFGAVAGIVDRIKKQRDARDARDGVC